MIRWPFMSRRKHEAEMANAIYQRDATRMAYCRKRKALIRATDELRQLRATLATAERSLEKFRASRDRQLANLRLGTAASAAKRKERAHG